MKKKLLIAALVVFTVFLGFMRDFVFVSINRSIAPEIEMGGGLAVLKWLLTFVFFLLYLATTCGFLYVLFQKKGYMLLAVFAYVFLFVISFLAIGFGYCFSSFAAVYPFVRTLMGIAQSPVVMMILISACYIKARADKAG